MVMKNNDAVNDPKLIGEDGQFLLNCIIFYYMHIEYKCKTICIMFVLFMLYNAIYSVTILF